MTDNNSIATGFDEYDLSDVIDKGNGRGKVRTALYNRLDEIKKYVERTGKYGVVFKVKFYERPASAATAARETTQNKGDRVLPTVDGARWEGHVKNIDGGAWYCVSLEKEH